MGRTGGGVFNTLTRSGTNDLHGTGLFQMRPGWGQTNNYFSEAAGLPKPDSPDYLGGGGVGGALVRNRTFFWFASENYHDVQTRNASVTMPTRASGRGLLAVDQCVGTTGAHLRPADRAAVRRQHHPDQSPERGRHRDVDVPALR